MKKLFEAIISFFKRLFGIKQKPVEEPTQTDITENPQDEPTETASSGITENPQTGTTEPETPPQEEVDCSKLRIYPKGYSGFGGKITFKAKYE